MKLSCFVSTEVSIRVIKRIGLVGLAAATSQLLQFFAQPLLAKNASAIEFGAQAKLSTLCALLAILAGVQLHIAYLSENDRDAGLAIRRVANLASLTFSAIAAAVSVAVGWQASESLTPQASGAFIGLLIWAYSTGNFQISMLVKVGALRTVALFTASRAVLVIVIQYLLVINSVPDGLLWGLVAGETLSRLLVNALIPPKSVATGIGDLPSVTAVLSRHVHFTAFGTIQEIISAFNFLAPLLLIPLLYGSFLGGLFAVAHRLTWAPVQLVNQAVGAIVTNEFSRSDLSRLNSILKIYLAAVGPSLVVVALVLWCAGSIFIGALFSAEWLPAKDMVGWIALWAGSFFVSLPARYVIRVRRLQAIQLKSEMLMAALVFIAALNLTDANDFIGSVCAGGAIQNIFLVVLVAWKVVRNRPDHKFSSHQ